MKKNVIIICVDGARLNKAQNSSIIKQFSPNSIFFTQAITYAPYTNSAIHALISGAYGNRNGCYSYWHSSRFKHQLFKTLVDYLHDENYFTCADLVSDLVLPKKNFDYYEVYDESNVNLETRHVSLLEKMKEKFDNGNNFFLYLHYSGIHTGIRDQVLKVFDNFSKEFFENKVTNEERYDKLFVQAEKYLKTIQEKLFELDFFKNSIILLISDHGISIGEKIGERAYGSFCYDYTIRTFANYNSPDLSSSEFNDQVSHVDFMPTILEHLEIPQNKNFEELDNLYDTYRSLRHIGHSGDGASETASILVNATIINSEYDDPIIITQNYNFFREQRNIGHSGDGSSKTAAILTYATALNSGDPEKVLEIYDKFRSHRDIGHSGDGVSHTAAQLTLSTVIKENGYRLQRDN